MDNNKFNNFYSKKSVSELLGQLRSNRMTGATMDKEWYEGLIAHLRERNLSFQERNMFEYIISTDPETLMTESEPRIVEENINNNKMALIDEHEKWYHNWAAIFFTITAAVTIGVVVGIIIIGTLLSKKLGF